MWYGQEKGIDALNPVDIPLNLGELGATRQTVLIPWLKSAMGFCQAGKLPVLKRFSRTVQVSQLALAISPNDLAIALGVSECCPSESKLLSLAGAATWLAKETKARVVVLIPGELAECKALDSILYGAIRPGALELKKIAETTAGESKYIVWPLQGKPHPFSPGEQLLAKKLSQDAELSSLFYFNHTVETVHGQKYLVDLLWAEGKIVVEIDGYRHHGNTFAFVRDRQRDYELLISGYLVLRLAHDEVVNDVEIAVEKIRNVVRFRRNSTIFKSEVQS
jgi:very-short-patch-repair endonuclease